MSPNDPKVAEAVAIQDESSVRISILREQYRLTQASDDTFSKAKLSILHEDSKQKIVHDKEIHEETLQVLAKENKTRRKTTNMEKEKREEVLTEMAMELQVNEKLRRAFMKIECEARIED
jgi:shikimate kinase